jgi:hypothetical protein
MACLSADSHTFGLSGSILKSDFNFRTVASIEGKEENIDCRLALSFVKMPFQSLPNLLVRAYGTAKRMPPYLDLVTFDNGI